MFEPRQDMLYHQLLLQHDQWQHVSVLKWQCTVQ